MLIREAAKHAFHARKNYLSKYTTTALTRKTTRTSSLSSLSSSKSQARQYSSENGGLLEQKVSTLSNGIRVASEETPGHFCGIGVYVDAGSRYEWAGDSGSTHMIDRLAWKVKILKEKL